MLKHWLVIDHYWGRLSLYVFKTVILLLYYRVFGSMALIWAVNDYFYIAGSLNAENLPGNLFTNFSLLALTELPSVFVGQFLMGILIQFLSVW